VQSPRHVCSITVVGAARIELRPEGFTEGSSAAGQYEKWYKQYGNEFGHRAEFFNAEAAANTGSEYGAEFKDVNWAPVWVWEPNAEMIIEAWLYDENDYPLYHIMETYGITYHEPDIEGNEAADELSQKAPEDQTIGGGTEGFGMGASTGSNAFRPAPSNPFDSTSSPSDYQKGKGSTLGKSAKKASADAKENSNLGDKYAVHELADVKKLDKYSGIQSSTFHYELFTYGDWVQDPKCLVDWAIRTFPTVNQTTMKAQTDRGVLVNGFFKTWTDSVAQTFNQLNAEKVKMIQHPCYYSMNWPAPDDRLELVDAGRKEGDMPAITDWDTIERTGLRLRAEALEGTAGYDLSVHGSFVIPAGTELRFATPKRKLLRHPGTDTLPEEDHEVITGGIGISQSGVSSAEVTIAAEKKVSS